jgi:hypothetical protein
VPFTISHAAAVLPFSRLLARWRLLSAALIGAMVPDFGLFLPWRPTRLETHSIVGLLSFCLPVGLAAYWLFQYLIKTPILELLPEGAYARWRPYASTARIFSVRQWVLAVLGIFAGAVSHLVWDGFTHEGARGVRMLPMLDEPILEYGGHWLRGVYILQDLSSLLGLLAVLCVIIYALRPGREAPVPGRPLKAMERRLWILLYVTMAVTLMAGWVLWARLGGPFGHGIHMTATNFAIASLRGGACALLVVSIPLGMRLRAHLRARAERMQQAKQTLD